MIQFQKMSVGESWQEYSKRMGQSLADAYPAWRAHGEALAKAWQKPFRSLTPEGRWHDHVTISGGRFRR